METSNINTTEIQGKTVNQRVLDDLKHSVLIVSLVANLFAFSAWLALQLV